MCISLVCFSFSEATYFYILPNIVYGSKGSIWVEMKNAWGAVETGRTGVDNSDKLCEETKWKMAVET